MILGYVLRRHQHHVDARTIRLDVSHGQWIRSCANRDLWRRSLSSLSLDVFLGEPSRPRLARPYGSATAVDAIRCHCPRECGQKHLAPCEFYRISRINLSPFQYSHYSKISLEGHMVPKLQSVHVHWRRLAGVRDHPRRGHPWSPDLDQGA